MLYLIIIYYSLQKKKFIIPLKKKNLLEYILTISQLNYNNNSLKNKKELIYYFLLNKLLIAYGYMYLHACVLVEINDLNKEKSKQKYSIYMVYNKVIHSITFYNFC